MGGLHNPPPAGAFASSTTVGFTTAPNSTTVFTMAGLGVLIKPKRSGNILAVFSGIIVDASSVTVGDGISYEISFGTGVAPANNAALTGTQLTPGQSYVAAVAPAAADVNIPFCIQALVTGSILGTQYWFDLAQKALGHVSQYGFSLLTINLLEL